MSFAPSGMDPAAVRQGLLLAMVIGQPDDPAERPTFLVPGTGRPAYSRDGDPVEAETLTLDLNGRPLDPSVTVVRAQATSVQIPVAVEFVKADAHEVPVGAAFRPTKAIITVLDRTPSTAPPADDAGAPLWEQDVALYDQVAAATDVRMGRDTYKVLYEQPVTGLGSIDVHTLVCMAREET